MLQQAELDEDEVDSLQLENRCLFRTMEWCRNPVAGSSLWCTEHTKIEENVLQEVNGDLTGILYKMNQIKTDRVRICRMMQRALLHIQDKNLNYNQAREQLTAKFYKWWGEEENFYFTQRYDTEPLTTRYSAKPAYSPL